MNRAARLIVIAVATLSLTIGTSGMASATTAGTWTAYPGQSTVYETQVKQPINADGSSVFANNMKSIIPVKFALLSGLGPFVFESIWSDNATDTTTGSPCDPFGHANDCSFLTFTPSSTLTFNQVTVLKAFYNFTTGNCHGGSLRWSVSVDVGNDGNTANDGSVFIYYGAYPNFTDCTSPDSGGFDTNQSGENMLAKTDLRCDTSQFVGGTFYDTCAHAKTLVGNDHLQRASLVLDSGWGGDQRLTLGSATVNDNTFTPAPATPLTSTCKLPPADIRVTKESGVTPGLVNEPVSIQPADVNGHFRIVDCKYMYNLATSSLSGTGTYKVEAVINGTAADGAAHFSLK